MAKKGIDVGVEITGSAKGFKASAEDAKKATDELRKRAAARSREMEQDFKKVTIALTKITGAVILIQKGFETFASVMKTTEGGSDKLEEAIGGLKEGFFELKRNISGLDFSKFLSDLKEGYNRGKELTAALDDLVDRTSYSDYIIQGLKYEKAALQEIVKNKTLEISVRADAADKITRIAEKIQKREEEIALKAFNIQKRSWEGRNKMATEEAIKLYETIDNLSTETEDQLARGYAYTINLFGKKKGIEMVLEGGGGRGLMKGIPEDVIQSYGKYLQLLNTGEADVLPKLFKTHKDYLQTVTEAQLEYNSTLKETSALLAKEDKALEKLANTADDLADKRIDSAWFMIENKGGMGTAFRARMRAAGASIGDVGNFGDANNVPYGAVAKGNGDLLKQQQLIINLQGTFESMFLSIKGGWKEVGDAMVSTIERMAAEMAAKAAIWALMAIIFPESLVFKSMGKIGKYIAPLAEGGIASKPTLAQIGEYSGASYNPEIVAPLSKLKGLMGSQTFDVRLKGKLAGSDIYFSLLRYQEMLTNNS
jgi:hypothetical protein